MIEIRPNVLYSRADLAGMLTPAGVNVDHFIARLRPRKVFKMVWLGADILKALEQAPPLEGGGEDHPEVIELPKPVSRGRRGPRGRSAAPGDPNATLAGYLQSLKEGRP